MKFSRNIFTTLGAVATLATAMLIGGNSWAATPSAQSPAAKAVEIAHGAKLWSERCGSCHQLRDPQEYSDEQWDILVAHMRVRAQLTGAEYRAIRLFLESSN